MMDPRSYRRGSIMNAIAMNEIGDLEDLRVANTFITYVHHSTIQQQQQQEQLNRHHQHIQQQQQQQHQLQGSVNHERNLRRQLCRLPNRMADKLMNSSNRFISFWKRE